MCKKLEIDFTPKKSSQLVTHLLLPWFKITTLFQSRIQQNMNLVANENVIARLCQKGWNFIYSHALVGELWKYSYTMSYLWTTFMCCYMHSCLDSH